MSQKLMSQIRFLCRQIHNDEWSGILFYTSEGEFGTEGFGIVAQELYLMDIGSATYTEYDWADPDLIKYMMTNPNVRSMQKGHIHSHNKMSVFFSGTDVDELIENSENHNYYLSVIVNNDGDICAKVAFRASMKVARTCTFRDGNGELITRTFTDKEETESTFSYDCNITTPDELEDGFTQRFLDLREEKARAKTVYTSHPKTDYSQKGYGGQADDWDESLGIGAGGDQTLFEDVHDANSKYATGGMLSDEFWEQNKPKEKVSGTNSRVAPVAGFMTIDKERVGETTDIITLATRLVALDPGYNGLLGPMMKRVYRGFWKEPIPDKALKVETYFKSIRARAVEYYRIVFMRDTNMVNFAARMGNVLDSISLYKEEHPELVAGIRNVIENVIIDTKALKTPPNGKTNS